jgi:ribosomal protein L37E
MHEEGSECSSRIEQKKNCAANGHGTQSIKSRRTEWAADAC